MAAKQIIVLNQSTSESQVTYTIAFWYPITIKPLPQTAGSAWTPVAGVSTGASAAENTAIQNGTIKEEVRSFSFPVGTPAAAIEAVLQQSWTDRAAQINSIGPEQFYGSFFDGTAWGQA